MSAAPAWVAAALASTFTARWSFTLLPVTGPPVVLPVTAGSVAQDATTYPRSTLTLTLAGLDLAPRRATDPLTPFGARIRADYTVADGTGRTFTTTPLPLLLVDTVTVRRGAGAGITVTASDPSLAVDTDAFITPTRPPQGSTGISSAIAWLIKRTFPDARVVDSVGSSRYVGSDWVTDTSPWSTIEGLADQVGAEVFVDELDRWRVRAIPGPTSPVEALTVGEGGTITAATSTLMRGYNRVGIALRSPLGATRVGSWADRSGGVLDARGPYGRVTFVADRDGKADTAERNAAAAALARPVAGRVREVEVEAPSRPWLALGETVQVTLPGGTADLVLDAVEHTVEVPTTRYRFRTDTVGPL